jgi:predicted DNA-binding protein (MmcQ/YjbR family)
MAEGQSSSSRAVQALRQAALRHADVQESVACKGTAIESATFKVGGRVFLFLRSGRVMVRLDRSQEEATRLAEEKPACYKVGSGGWTTVSSTGPKELSLKLLEKWIAESYRLFASAGGSKKAKGK